MGKTKVNSKDLLQDLTIPQANLAKVYLTLLNEIK